MAGTDDPLEGGKTSGRSARAIERVLGDSLLRNSGLMIATTLVNALLGFAYWVVAARVFDAAEVGLASAVISALILGSLASNLGIHTAFVQLLPALEDEDDWRSALTSALLLGAGGGLVAGMLLVIGLPLLDETFEPLADPVYGLTFVLGVVLWTVCLIVDWLFVAHRAAFGMFARNALFAVCKIPLLLAPLVGLVQEDSLAIVAGWVLGSAISCVFALWLLLPRIGRKFRLTTRSLGSKLAYLSRGVVAHHFVNLGGSVPIFILPVMVAALVSATSSAYFYSAFMLAGLFFTVSPSVADSLFAEGASDPEDLWQRARKAAITTAALLIPAALFCIAAGRPLLEAFGESYADEGYSLLVIFAASAFPRAIANIYVAMLRVERRFAFAALITNGSALLTVVLGWVLLQEMGLVGASVAWLAAQTAAALIVGLDMLVSRSGRLA